MVGLDQKNLCLYNVVIIVHTISVFDKVERFYPSLAHAGAQFKLSGAYRSKSATSSYHVQYGF